MNKHLAAIINHQLTPDPDYYDSLDQPDWAELDADKIVQALQINLYNHGRYMKVKIAQAELLNKLVAKYKNDLPECEAVFYTTFVDTLWKSEVRRNLKRLRDFTGKTPMGYRPMSKAEAQLKARAKARAHAERKLTRVRG